MKLPILGPHLRFQMKPEWGQALFHVALASCLCVATVHTGIFEHVSVQVGYEYYAEAPVTSLPAFLAMPFNSYTNATYFTLRSGGKVLVTFLFDGAYMWGVVIPLAAGIAYFTDLPILVLFAAAQGIEIFKCILGYIFLKRGTWVKQLVADESLKA